MTYLNTLKSLIDDLNNRGVLDDVYEACRTVDMAGAVIAALKVLQDTGNLLEIEYKNKNEDLAATERNSGLRQFHKRNIYRTALEYYNKALLQAPSGSINHVLTYHNRSAVLLKAGVYADSLEDIETCLKFQFEKNMPHFFRDTGLLRQLTTMKIKCEREIKSAGISVSLPPEDICRIKGNIHPEIPCLSADIDIVNESGRLKAVAIKDIPVGTLLLVETAYVTCSNEAKSILACYYCQKMSFHLIPCNNCCYALFCSKKCEELCLNEYHRIECQIMDLLQKIDIGGRFRLAIKTVLKLKNQCKQWSTLIKESENIGANRLTNSSTKEIYDVNNYSSMLSFNSNRHFIHGPLFNSCFIYAIVIYYLHKISGFFPVKQNDCLQAKRCLAKLFMTLELMWPSITEINTPAMKLEDPNYQGDVSDYPYHYGLLAFTSKLKHNCEPNVLLVGKDNQVYMFAIHPIKNMTELKISHM